MKRQYSVLYLASAHIIAIAEARDANDVVWGTGVAMIEESTFVVAETIEEVLKLIEG